MNLPFPIALEYCTMMAQCQMVDKVQSADHDKCACDPECARIPTKDDLLVGLGADVDVVGGRDHDAIIDRMARLTLDN